MDDLQLDSILRASTALLQLQTSCKHGLCRQRCSKQCSDIEDAHRLQIEPELLAASMELTSKMACSCRLW